MTFEMAPRRRLAAIVAAAAIAAGAQGAAAQSGDNPFGSFKHDSTQPIEITADSLAVNNQAQTATFTGEVVAGQGTLRLTADKVTVNYGGAGGGQASSQGTGEIEKLRAEGSVFLSSGAETAKGEWAEYDVSNGVVTMGGDVVLTQGENAISGQSLRIDLNAGVGEISGGRVKSVFSPPSQNGG
ncbi:lipopolysaccharide transport periplasmic protein LptA [Albimonas sp. CAU 1670]|uniref:lipopolysaccharide transport periplasmic protein LptA n=1 Tax=Albimonas sp. CAU 1670 TaxID=3032599 RepID=UPI0023DBE92D|nr:lipopolysaccharide transport periplasmic protein LptA [Albimonas sp. CAU 1670]MDF2233436.1 lipopolysaccharide transport periplasmic protein LptA [Albimonas sp. CAU 1670]